jgi:hypothetical protein
MNNPKMMQIVFAIPRANPGEKKTWWMKAGVAFQNGDGSWNLLFDVLPARPDITIQLREMRPKEQAAPTAAASAE